MSLFRFMEATLGLTRSIT